MATINNGPVVRRLEWKWVVASHCHEQEEYSPDA